MLNIRLATYEASKRTAAAFWSASASAQAAGVTIALRWPILMQAAFDPFAWPARREAMRAVTEKWEAAVEGSMAAWAASASLASALVLSPGDARKLTHGLAAVSSAAMRPARKRVRGNARRLSRG